MAKPFSRNLRRGAIHALPKRAQRKARQISFQPSENKVYLVKVPPKKLNNLFWFSEKRKIVKKGLNFSLEPNINIAITVDCRMQITALSKSIEQEESAKHKGAAGKRGFLEIREELPFGRQMPWMCVGSVEPAGMEKIKVVLPAGSYHVRSIGASLAVFCLVYDIEAELS